MGDIINQIIILTATGSVGGFFGWFFTRKKQDVEVVGMVVDNEVKEIDKDSKVVELYKNALDDLSVRYEAKYREIEVRHSNIQSLFDKKEKILQQELELLKKQVALYKKMYDDKVKEFNKYKKEHP